MNLARPIPVILDTDIGDDIDDTWALAMMLKCPELDVRLVISDTGDTEYRARIIAKMLAVAGRTDVPVGVGIPFKHAEKRKRQAAWVADYSLKDYRGPVLADGVGAIIDTIMRSPQPITLIAIGPVPNLAAALEREPVIAGKARFVGMHGSVRMGYNASPQIAAEYNVRAHPAECRKVFTAPWDMTITPLDTCGLVRLTGEKFRAVESCRDGLIQALMENYRCWLRARGEGDAPAASSVLFDTVAVYLAFSDELLKMERLGIHVTDEGLTVIDPAAKQVNCAMEWKNLPAFEDLLVQRLTR